MCVLMLCMQAVDQAAVSERLNEGVPVAEQRRRDARGRLFKQADAEDTNKGRAQAAANGRGGSACPLNPLS